jgi:hypothetical protein
MIASLPDLIAPLREPDFIDLLRGRQSLHFQRGADPGRYKSLLDWATLRGLIETGAIKPDNFWITCNTHNVPPLFYLRNGKVDRTLFGDLIARGTSVVTKPIEAAVPPLKALCADIGARLGEPVKADAVVTVGAGGALKMHYDYQDLFILQVEGSKRWRVYGPPVKDPIKGLPKIAPPETAPLFDEVLQPGDLLFMPGGYWHHCDNGPDVSLHIVLLHHPAHRLARHARAAATADV